jgi:hypothetical protein
MFNATQCSLQVTGKPFQRRGLVAESFQKKHMGIPEHQNPAPQVPKWLLQSQRRSRFNNSLAMR